MSKNQYFAEAQKWFHYIFDPTDDSDGPEPDRFWKVKPFQCSDIKSAEEILINLATGADTKLQNETLLCIKAWQEKPFRPHLIAGFRPDAYKYKTVMAYLDNLIAWGDMLFKQDTGESVDEALMLYVLAANILGPKPQPVPQKGTIRAQTYANLRSDLREFGTVIRDLESDVCYGLMPMPAKKITARAEAMAVPRSLGKALYFCVPRNDKLLSYWDTVADRLFKIRNSLNYQGTFRQLPLFEPPIDPAMLARAVAAGVNVNAVISGLSQPLPLVRFQLLLQKASEICQEIKSLGNNLLSAMEKEDGEAMSILRAKHERIVLEMVEQVKYSQLQEAKKSCESLFKSLALAMHRYVYYELQIGKKLADIAIPVLDELDKDNLTKMNFSQDELTLIMRDINPNIATDLSESSGMIISGYEREELAKLKKSQDATEEASGKDKIAAGLSMLPNLGIDFHFWGIGGDVHFGGPALSAGMSLWASFARSNAEKQTYAAGKTSKIGSYDRRQQEWVFQSNLAAGEIMQIFKQIRAAQLREAIAEQELKNHRQQMKHAEEIEHFLNEEGTEKNGKITNKSFYTWMKREVKGLYAQCFQFAYDIAKKAERALQHELGDTKLSYIQTSYLTGKEGLLAGERLHLDLKRMEMAYHDLNLREHELTKHISLSQVNPLALLQLRAKGNCIIKLPEALFDMDCPGHYFRRIKSVALTIPCVIGPYASVNCTLTLLKSSIRIAPNGKKNYIRESDEDIRFKDYYGSTQAIVTSTAQNDSGMFETNLRDERYLPFEGSGVISEWQLELPADFPQFDHDTISDVIMHIRYTARPGGDKQGAIDSFKNSLKVENNLPAIGTTRLFSLRHDFPTEWSIFKNQCFGTDTDKYYKLAIKLQKMHYPFWSQGYLNKIVSAQIISDKQFKIKKDSETKDSIKDEGIGLYTFPLPKDDTSIDKGTSYEITFANNDIDNLWLAVIWSN